MILDQKSLYFQATLTWVWARQAQTLTLRVANQRESVHFYGGLNMRSGRELALTLPQQSGKMTCHFLDYVQAAYPGRALSVLWNRAKWHQEQEYLSQHLHIQTLHFLPCCPQLNPQEHVWERAPAMRLVTITLVRIFQLWCGFSPSSGDHRLHIRVDREVYPADIVSNLIALSII